MEGGGVQGGQGKHTVLSRHTAAFLAFVAAVLGGNGGGGGGKEGLGVREDSACFCACYIACYRHRIASPPETMPGY